MIGQLANAAVLLCVAAAAVVGAVYAGVYLEVKHPAAQWVVCTADRLLAGNFGYYERALRPADAWRFCFWQ